MGSLRTRGVTVLAVALAAGAITQTAAAAGILGGGLTGYVTDADTGLGLGGATIAWPGFPAVASGGDGRYLVTGLTPGATGALAVAGPAGYERASIPNITLPTANLGGQNVALHRVWSATAGGATTTSNDVTHAAQGCGPAAATDDDPSTGWSSTTAQDDPAALTIALPQTIDARRFIIDNSPACGHPSGAALGAYEILTSQDGATFTPAAEGTLASTPTSTTITPTTSATQIRYVRLQALAAVDPSQPTIDVREFQVQGVGPNAAPVGSASVEAPRNYVNGVVRFRAAFTDADSTITRYLWDFDGDGRFDQATNGPAVAHVFAAAGTYRVTVGARDFRGSLGTTALDVRIIDPNALLEPIIQRRPLITFDPVDGVDLPVRIACSSKCTFTASLVLSKATAKAIKSKRRTILTFKRRTEGPGLGSWTLTLPNRTITLLRKAHKTSVKARLTASAVDQQKRRTTVRRWVTFR